MGACPAPEICEALEYCSGACTKTGVAPVTLEDLKRAKHKQIAHLRYADGGYGYWYRCVQYPEWEMHFDTPTRRAKEIVTWFVRGVEAPRDMKAIVDLLNSKEAENG